MSLKGEQGMISWRKGGRQRLSLRWKPLVLQWRWQWKETTVVVEKEKEKEDEMDKKEEVVNERMGGDWRIQMGGGEWWSFVMVDSVSRESVKQDSSTLLV